LPSSVRRVVLRRDGYLFVCCGKSIADQPYTLLSRLRPSLGGGNGPENLITVHGPYGEGCSSLRRGAAASEKGYRLTLGQDPAKVPVVYATASGPARFWLRPDGSRSSEPPEEGSAP